MLNVQFERFSSYYTYRSRYRCYFNWQDILIEMEYEDENQIHLLLAFNYAGAQQLLIYSQNAQRTITPLRSIN